MESHPQAKWALAWHLKTRLPPQTVHTSKAHHLTVAAKKDRDPPVATTSDIAPPTPPSAPAPAYPSPASSSNSATRIARHRAACKPAVATGPCPSRTLLRHA